MRHLGLRPFPGAALHENGLADLPLFSRRFLRLRRSAQHCRGRNFYGGVARQIAGDGANVTSILTNPNQDPHEFTSNAGTARAVAEADIVIYNGIGYDTWIEKLLATRGGSRGSSSRSPG